jgi:hypothetical protein
VERGKATKVEYSQFVRAEWLGMLTAVAVMRGYKPGWAAHKFKEKFGDWPPRSRAVTPIAPSDEVLAWVRSRNIAFAKAKQRDVA